MKFRFNEDKFRALAQETCERFLRWNDSTVDSLAQSMAETAAQLLDEHLKTLPVVSALGSPEEFSDLWEVNSASGQDTVRAFLFDVETLEDK